MVQAELKVMSGPLTGTNLQIDSYAVVLGRSPESTFDLSAYTELSRQHAVIRWDGTGWLIEDQNSSNGTQIDGTPIQMARLGSGSVIELGDFKAEFITNSHLDGTRRHIDVVAIKQTVGGSITALVLLIIVGGGLVGGYHWVKSLLHPRRPPTISLPTKLPVVLSNSIGQLPNLSPGIGNLHLPAAITSGVNSRNTPSTSAQSPSLSTPNATLTNAQALIMQQDASGNWFRVGAGTVINSNTVLAASTEVLNLANKVTDVEVVIGSSAPYIREDVPASSITLHADVARITLNTPVMLPLPTLSQTTELMNTTVTIVLLDDLASSTAVHLQDHPVIANYYLEPNTKQQTLSGFEVNYHDQYNYAGAPVFDLNNNLVGMTVGTRHSETFNRKLVVYGYNMAYLQGL